MSIGPELPSLKSQIHGGIRGKHDRHYSTNNIIIKVKYYNKLNVFHSLTINFFLTVIWYEYYGVFVIFDWVI